MEMIRTNKFEDDKHIYELIVDIQDEIKFLERRVEQTCYVIEFLNGEITQRKRVIERLKRNYMEDD